MNDELSKAKEWGADLQKRLIEAGKDEEFAVQNLMGEAACCLKLFESALSSVEQEPVKLEDIEQYRMQMAGISTAAIGYWKPEDGIHPDYDTVALRDVAALYAKYDELYKATSPIASGKDAWISVEERLPLLPKADFYYSTVVPEDTPTFTTETLQTYTITAQDKYAAPLIERIKELEADLKERTAALNIAAALNYRAQCKAEELEKQNAELRFKLDQAEEWIRDRKQKDICAALDLPIPKSNHGGNQNG